MVFQVPVLEVAPGCELDEVKHMAVASICIFRGHIFRQERDHIDVSVRALAQERNRQRCVALQ